MNLCELGKKIALRCNNVCVQKDGECTELYWHIYYCSNCREIRDKENSNV